MEVLRCRNRLGSGVRVAVRRLVGSPLGLAILKCVEVHLVGAHDRVGGAVWLHRSHLLEKPRMERFRFLFELLELELGQHRLRVRVRVRLQRRERERQYLGFQLGVLAQRLVVVQQGERLGSQP